MQITGADSGSSLRIDTLANFEKHPERGNDQEVRRDSLQHQE